MIEAHERPSALARVLVGLTVLIGPDAKTPRGTAARGDPGLDQDALHAGRAGGASRRPGRQVSYPGGGSCGGTLGGESGRGGSSMGAYPGMGGLSLGSGE